MTYAVDRPADLVAREVHLSDGGSTFRLVASNLELSVRSPLRGAFNVYNSLGAAGAALALGVSGEDVVQGLAAVSQVPGRFESVDGGQPFSVLVDYAHTPDSLEQALGAARQITTGRLLVVFGCGGDRDAGKRALMGGAAARLADVAIVTSDNPRSESPATIIEQIEAGLDRRNGLVTESIEDRRAAIARAFEMARAGDTVLIAGKGHETGQTFADETVPFDDRRVAIEEAAKRWGRPCRL